MKLNIYTDGGARGNPGPAAVGIVVCDSKGTIVFRFGSVIGHATNNIAEYCALIAALEIAKRFQADELECFTDSELMMNQMCGNYKIKSEHIKNLHARAKKLESQFKSVAYHHRRRETPLLQEADRMVNDALDGKI